MKYAFSLHPSIKNGLVQNEDREPNDTPSMAAPLTLAEVTSGITGSLHFTRDAYTSMRATDDTDMYRISIAEAGTYTVDMSLLEGTGYGRVEVRFVTDNGSETPITNDNDLYKTGDTHSIDLPLAVGEYYLKISKLNAIAKYTFKMTKNN